MKPPLPLSNKYQTLFSYNSSPSPPRTIKRRRRILGQWTGIVNPQLGSSFLTKLPPELRNQIYTYVFSSSFVPNNAIAQSHDSVSTTHNLSLLLTCRLINTEATLLAFHTYTFHISGDLTFHGIRQRTTHLTNAQFDAIRSVSCTPYPAAVFGNNNLSTAEVVRNILVLFENVTNLEVRLGEDKYGGVVWIGSAMRATRGWEWVWEDGGRGKGVDYVRTVMLEGESGRRVKVVVVRIGDVRLDDVGVGRLGVRLGNGDREVCEEVDEVRSKGGLKGFVHDPGEEFWADLRNRKIVVGRGEIDRGRDEDLPGN